MNKPTILVVEDDSSVRSLITTTLKAHGYKFLTAANGEMAVMMRPATTRILCCWISDCRILMALR